MWIRLTAAVAIIFDPGIGQTGSAVAWEWSGGQTSKSINGKNSLEVASRRPVRTSCMTIESEEICLAAK
jgi:hypothetical protein